MTGSYKALLAAIIGTVLLLAAPMSRAQDKPLSAMDKMFLRKVSEGNTAEVMTAKLAIKKSGNKKVRELAQMLAMEHGKAQADLMNVSKKVNYAVPSKPSAQDKAMYRQLSRMSGPAFDKAFLAGQIKAHNATVDLIMKEMNEGDESHVRDYAAKQYGPISAHTTLVYNTAGQLGLPVGKKAVAARAK